jgi:hypothetical protein
LRDTAKRPQNSGEATFNKFCSSKFIIGGPSENRTRNLLEIFKEGYHHMESMDDITVWCGSRYSLALSSSIAIETSSGPNDHL